MTWLLLNEIKYQVTTVLKMIKRVHKQNLSLVFCEEAIVQIYMTINVDICLSKKEKN